MRLNNYKVLLLGGNNLDWGLFRPEFIRVSDSPWIFEDIFSRVNFTRNRKIFFWDKIFIITSDIAIESLIKN